MNKRLWKKGVSMTLAAMMMAGSMTVPAVYSGVNAAIVKADQVMPEAPTAVGGMIYATVNMEYADFYYGELKNIAAGTSVTPELSEDKAAGYRETGMYDAVTSATTTKSKRFGATYYTENVVNDESNGEATGVNIEGIKDVKIAIPEELYANLYASADQSHKVFDYLANATYSEEAFAEYKVLNADGTFSKMTTESTVLSDVEASITTSTSWGNYQISLEGLPEDVTTDNMMGVVMETSDGAVYGMEHLDNLWLRTNELSFAIKEGFVEPHGNDVPYLRYADMEGKTITKLTYLLKDGTDYVINTNLFCKTINGAEVKGTAENAVYNEAGTAIKMSFENLPAEYTLSVVQKGRKHPDTIAPENYSYDAATSTLTLDGTCMPSADYSAIFVSEKFGDVKVSFAIEGLDQEVTVEKDAYEAVYGDEAFNLNAKAETTLSYTSSDEAVASVDEAGNVTVNGAGTAVITVTAAEEGAYKGAAKEVTVTVAKKVASVKVAKTSYKKVYGNKAFNLGATSNGAALSYKSSNTKVAKVSSKGLVTIVGTGKATITVTAAGENYEAATKKVTVTVVPKKQTVKVASPAKKQLKVTWTKDTKATGYQILVSTKKNMKNAKSYVVTSNKTTMKVIKGLKSKQTYYVKVRAYKTSGTKLYGAYSAVKSVKVK